MPLVTVTKTDGTTEQVEMPELEDLVHAADADGKYVGLLPISQAVHRVPGAPRRADTRWSPLGGWVLSQDLEAMRRAALQTIDGLAGAARLRHITDVPGQQAVYDAKLRQAGHCIALIGAEPAPELDVVPPYVMAEANATGLSPIEAARAIVSSSQEWLNVTGPLIESERRKAKIAAKAAPTLEALDEIVAAASAALREI